MPRSLTRRSCRCFSRGTRGPLLFEGHHWPFARDLIHDARGTGWPLERAWGPIRKSELHGHLSHYTVLPVNRELCRKWAEISSDAKRRGQPIQTADAWIAASALYYRVPLITNNRDDYPWYGDLPCSRPKARLIVARVPASAGSTHPFFHSTGCRQYIHVI
jgi:hypothetical protein